MMDMDTPSADFDKKPLAHLASMVGKPTPTTREMTQTLGVSRGVVEAGFYRLVKQGLVVATGNGNYRTITVKGVGDTLPRLSKADRIAAKVEFEPMRTANFTCPRCGARNCQRHSASFLTTRAIPAWRAGA